jgi:cytochrome c oxidase subunit 1
MAMSADTMARRFFWSGLAFLFLGGALAMLLRLQLAFPDRGFSPSTYAGLFTSHGLIMIFFAITPLLINAFGSLTVPRLIGAPNLAFPRVNAFSFWILLCGQALALSSLVVPATLPSSGWTMYPPLSTGLSIPGIGMTLMLAAIACAGVATVLGAINVLTTILFHRRPALTWMQMPLTVWGLGCTAVLNALFVPVLIAACALLLCDRAFDTQFFLATTGDPLLYQHLFWIFAHPEVYILILPVWGLISDVIAEHSGRPLHWQRGTVFAFIAVTALSGLVYGHHLLQAGMAPLFGTVFVVFTLAISVPSVVIAMNWLLSLHGGALRFEPAMMFALATLLVFGLGGLSGMPLASVTSDLYLHDTLWVVGHFHLIMAAATLFGSFAAVYHWAPALLGKKLHRGLGIAHVATTVPFAILTFGSLLVAGYHGQLRRLADPRAYDFTGDLSPLTVHTSVFAFALGASQLLFLVNLLKKGKPDGG